MGNENFYFTIKNIINLTINGLENQQSFIIENRDSPVLNFYNNINISLNQVQAKHDLPVEEECGIHAPVFQFINDKNVTIDKCSMNGSGTQGIYAMNINSLIVDNSKIFNCSSSALNLINVNYCVLNNSNISANNFSTIFSINKANLLVNNTIISKNITDGFVNKAFVSNNSPDFVLFKNEEFKSSHHYNILKQPYILYISKLNA